MLQVYLYTARGGFVARVELAPFKQLPDIVFWGTRVFKHHNGLAYREAAFCASAVGEFNLVDEPSPEALSTSLEVAS